MPLAGSDMQTSLEQSPGESLALTYGLPNEIDVWRVYHLMRGGIASPLTLSAITGVDVRRLNNLDAFFFDADSLWTKSPIAFVNLPKGKTVVCARCDAVRRSVPCWECETTKRGANWLARKTTSPSGEVQQLYPVTRGDETDRGRSFGSAIQYHGAHRDDV